AIRLHSPGHLEIRDTGLQAHRSVRDIDVEDATHAREADDDALGDRDRTARQAGARAAGDEGDAVRRAGLYRAYDLLGAVGKRHGERLRAIPGEPVGLVRAQRDGVGDDVGRADDAAEVGGQAHTGSLPPGAGRTRR